VPLPAWTEGPIHGDNPDYPYYAITFKTAETNFAENMTIPVIDKVTAGAAQTRGVLLNPRTAAALGIADGDGIVVVSAFGRVEGDAALSEGVHPDVVAVSNALTRRVGGRKGTHFNELLPAELEYTDNFSGALESVARVRVEKAAGEVAA
jgi:anaerobic selenocysteine-containing dehydrogenase